MRCFIRWTGLLLTTSAFAAGPRVQRDLAYAESKVERQTLDVSAAENGRRARSSAAAVICSPTG